MPFLQRSRKPIIILVSVIFSIGAFFFFKNNAPQEPVVIYKVTQSAPKQKQADGRNQSTHEHNHEHPHDNMSHSHALEATPSSEGYDWREDNGFGVSGSETDPWEPTYGQPEKVSENADAETYPPPDWHKTENPELYIQYLRAQLIKQFGDIPEVHIIVEDERKMLLGLPQTLDEYIAALEAMYHLWPTPGNKKTLEHTRELKANGNRVNIIFRENRR